MPGTVTNVLHFNRDGSDATVDFRTGNCSTPLAGFYDREADALVTLFCRYGHFGQPSYLDIACKAGDYYYDNHLAKGYVGGGPVEILQAPDSESAAALAESFVALYVNTENNHVQPGENVGWCTERVNISDWEGSDGVGNVPHDSNCAWENVNLYHITENPGIYVQPDTDFLMVIDHVNARLVSSDADSVTLEIENPGSRDGDVSVLAESSEYARANPLGWNAWYSWPKVHVPAGESVTVTLPFAAHLAAL